MNQYEGMFLFDPTFGSAFEACEAEVRRLMDRASAELVFCRRWDERRLAYRIKGRKRGVYALTYFRSAPDRIGSIERDVQISENVLRVLILRADEVTPDLMELAITHRETAATAREGRDEGPPGRRGEGRGEGHGDGAHYRRRGPRRSRGDEGGDSGRGDEHHGAPARTDRG